MRGTGTPSRSAIVATMSDFCASSVVMFQQPQATRSVPRRLRRLTLHYRQCHQLAASPARRMRSRIGHRHGDLIPETPGEIVLWNRESRHRLRIQREPARPIPDINVGGLREDLTLERALHQQDRKAGATVGKRTPSDHIDPTVLSPRRTVRGAHLDLHLRRKPRDGIWELWGSSSIRWPRGTNRLTPEPSSASTATTVMRSKTVAISAVGMLWSSWRPAPSGVSNSKAEYGACQRGSGSLNCNVVHAEWIGLAQESFTIGHRAYRKIDRWRLRRQLLVC